MDSNDIELLAQQLYAIYWEAIGKMRWEWDKLDPSEREAWIQVAEYVDKFWDGVEP